MFHVLDESSDINLNQIITPMQSCEQDTGSFVPEHFSQTNNIHVQRITQTTA